MRTFKYLAIGTVVVALYVGCAARGPLRPADAEFPWDFSDQIEFDLSFALFRSQNGSDRLLHIHVSFPRSRLLFLRDESRGVPGWQAEYEWSVIVRDRRGRQVGGGVYTGKIVLEGRERPEDPAAVLKAHKQFRLSPGRYHVEVTLSDKNSVRQGRWIEEIEAFEFQGQEPGLSQIEVLEPGITSPSVTPGGMKDDTHHREEVVASAASRETSDEIAFLYEAYNIGEGADVVYRLISGDGVEVRCRTFSLPEGLHLTVRDTMFIGGLADASYTLEVSLGNLEAVSLKEGRVVKIRRPLLAWGEDLEVTLSQLSLYATDEAVETFRTVPSERRRAYLDSLWEGLDPTPSTEKNELMDEFVRRLRYAEEHWRFGPLHGWNIDIGRIYIAYGQPDEVVDERSFRAATSPLDQDRQVVVRKWIYREPPVTFVFEYEPGRGWIFIREASSPLPPDR